MTVEIVGNEVTLKFQLEEGRPSSSGKTLVVYSTGGFVPVSDTNLRLNLTVIKPK